MLHLHACKVENYRGLREAHLEFEPLTVVIGENDCGRSSLLNALETCLGHSAPKGTFAFTPRDFHRAGPSLPPKGPIRIELVLRENTPPPSPAPWPALRAAGLAHPDGRLDFCLAVEVEPPQSGDARPVVPRVQVRFQGPGPLSGDPLELLAVVRQAVPLLRLRSAVLKPVQWPGRNGDPEDAARRQVDWEIRQAFEEVLEFRGALAGPTLDAAREHLKGALERLEPSVREALVEPDGVRGAEHRVMAPSLVTTPWSRLAGLLGGTGARSLAMLAFMEALLASRGSELLHPDCCPVVTFEDPEAYLHPVVLASVWSFIQRMAIQKIVTTNSADLLSAVPIGSVRRMVRGPSGVASLYRVPPGSLDLNELRRIAYHLRVLRASTLFMRFWLLVEGETEFWLVPEAARAMGFDLLGEGIGCVEFAQCGIAPLTKMANHLGIGWHLLADGDAAGRHYTAQATADRGLGRVTQIEQRDIEHCLWYHGYDDVFRAAAEGDAVEADPWGAPRSRSVKPTTIIERAIKRMSKPRMALALGEAMVARGPEGVPTSLRRMLNDAVHRARHGPHAFR